MDKPRIRVVSAYIERDARCFITQRRPEATLPLLWEFPGGRVEEGESDEDALKRELREETGLAATVVGADARRAEAHPGRPFEEVRPLVTVVGVEGAYPALVLVFACEADGTPRALPGETADPGWYPPDEVAALLEEPEQFTGPAALVLGIVLDR